MSWNQEMLVLPLLVFPLWVRYVIRLQVFSGFILTFHCLARYGHNNGIAKMCKAQVKITLWCVLQSTFLSLMTSTESEAASYEFTTLTCIPGVIQVLALMAWWHLDPFWSWILQYWHCFAALQYKGANIQLLDLPGIIEGAAQGEMLDIFIQIDIQLCSMYIVLS